jgi:hypothetical protein
MSLLTQASLVVTPNGYKEGTLYSVVPNNSNGDFSVTRATTATRVNAAGLVELVPYNLFTYSEMFSDSAWAKNGSTIGINATTAPNGTLTADKLTENSSNTRHNISRIIAVNVGAYVYSIYAKQDSRKRIIIREGGITGAYATFDLSTGSIVTSGAGATATIESVENGYYRCSVRITFPSSGNAIYVTDLLLDNGSVLADAIYLGDGTSGAFIWGAQLVEGTSALDYQKTETRLNIPRLDYSLGSCPNILLEPQRTNINTFSEEFNNATFWLRGTGVSVNANTSNSPSGTLTADTITGATGPFVWTGPNTFFRSYTTLSVSTAYTFSAYLKGTGSVTMTWRDGTTGGNNSLVCNLTASWQRFEITRTTGAASTGMALVFHSASGNFDAWGGQMELGAYATSYIPTSSASVTRNGDSLTRSNIFTNGLITASGGTWFVDIRNNLSLTRDVFSNGIYFYGSIGSFQIRNTSPGRLVIFKILNAVTSPLYTSLTDTLKFAIKWNGSTADLFVNGVKVVAATAFTETALQTLDCLGADVPKYINSMALWNTPLTDDELEVITGEGFDTYALMASNYNYILQ